MSLPDLFRSLRATFTAWRTRRQEPDLAIDRLPVGEFDSSLVFRIALGDLLRERQAQRRSGVRIAVAGVATGLAKLALFAAIGLWVGGFRFSPSGDVVGIVRLDGTMAAGSLASADQVIPALRKAFESDKVSAVVLSIDSPGGSPLEAERIYRAIQDLRRAHPKPVVAVIDNLGASAAYMVALHVDRIYAGNYSLVGSVGAVLAGWDAHEALNRLGLSQRVYASGELKSMMNPYLPMSAEAERKARELVEELGRAFRVEVETQRKGRLLEGVDVSSGGVWGGAEARRIGLIDEVSTIDQVVRARWPGLATQEFGPRFGGMGFGSASAWLQEVLAKSAGQPLALR